MDLGEAKAQLASCLRSAAVSGVEVYLFGSTVRGASSPEDVDVLLVYSDPDAERLARQALAHVWLGVPLHVLSMTPSEVHHYGFLVRTGAQRVWPAQTG